METKYFATFALLLVVVAVFVSTTECTPVPSELEGQVNPGDFMPAINNMNAPTGQRQGRFYGYGWPGYGGYGGLGGYGGSSSAAAAAAASSSSGGMGYGGYPYGK